MWRRILWVLAVMPHGFWAMLVAWKCSGESAENGDAIQGSIPNPWIVQ
jgi:hypothetical protein